jgi:hypothetical protein
VGAGAVGDGPATSAPPVGAAAGARLRGQPPRCALHGRNCKGCPPLLDGGAGTRVFLGRQTKRVTHVPGAGLVIPAVALKPVDVCNRSSYSVVPGRVIWVEWANSSLQYMLENLMLSVNKGSYAI